MLGEREERRSSGSLLILLAGGLVGAGIALLYAPLSGEETRRYLKMQKERARSRAQNLTENVKESVRSKGYPETASDIYHDIGVKSIAREFNDFTE